VAARAFSLPSERDQNFLLRRENAGDLVLKVSNANTSAAIIEAECALLQHVASTGLCPTLVAARDGALTIAHEGHALRVITALPGVPYGTSPLHTDALRRDVGRIVAQLSNALHGFDAPALHREFHWDLARAADVIRTYESRVANNAIREAMATFQALYARDVVPLLAQLPMSVIHGDANDYNVLVDVHTQRVTGIVDLGDAVFSHTVNDLAIAMAYVALAADDPLAAAAQVLQGYHAERPLSSAEIDVLFVLMSMRLCVSAGLAAAQSPVRPDDDYLTISQQPIARTLPQLAAVHPRFARYTFRHACGLPPVPQSPRVVHWLNQHAPQFAPVLGRDLHTTPIVPLDFSAGSTLISSELEQNEPALLDQRIQRLFDGAGATIGAGGYNEARLIYHWPLEPRAAEPRTIHIGLDLSAAPGTPIFAPLDGSVYGFEFANAHHDYGPVIVLRHVTTGDDPVEFFTLYGHLSVNSLHHLEVGQRIAKGTEFARIGSAPTNGNWWAHVHMQLIVDMLDVPCNVNGAVRASQREVWHSICPDPNLLLGIPGAQLTQHATSKEIAFTRERRLARNVSVSYGSEPLNIVRGFGQYLYNENAHRFIDAYNNVAHVGHSHPRVVRAVSDQLATLNTNTRYLQEQLTNYADALTATLPDELSVCFFTASGSEANELALRLARNYTNARDLIVMDAAYHGHTTTLIDISPYKHNGPGGNGPPDWVHTSPIPDTYRNREYTGEPGPWFAAQVGRLIDQVQQHDRALCGYIAETCPSVAGQIMLPDGYLAGVYDRVRAAGGVCIADEVQTGFGRLGSHFWAFEQHRVIPDIVVLGKPIANGYPMGAVVTTRAIAERFANGMEYFSTFGGSTAACVAARETLAVTLDEQLQQNAQRVGDRLLQGLRTLAASHDIIGDVRGAGLFIGVELVRDRETREPASDEASHVVQRMRAHGVLAGTDGPHHNVIKLRGPMCLSVDDAEQILHVIERALRETPR
jgi:4-aminobutyrate aminotransferase-like enzyme/Ser/Thr protein kinase RdoA (MazF antagonist)